MQKPDHELRNGQMNSHGGDYIWIRLILGWIEAFECRDCPKENIIYCRSAIFEIFWVPHTLVSDNAKEFVNDKVVTLMLAQGCAKLERPTYNPRSNGLAERAVQTV